MGDSLVIAHFQWLKNEVVKILKEEFICFPLSKSKYPELWRIQNLEKLLDHYVDPQFPHAFLKLLGSFSLSSQSSKKSCERIILRNQLVYPLEEIVSEASLEISSGWNCFLDSVTENRNIGHKVPILSKE